MYVIFTGYNIFIVIYSDIESCSWEGEMGSLNDHLKYCEFAEVRCENQGCVSIMQRRHMLGHSRDDCQYRLLTCPHCGIGITSIALKSHIEECGYRPIECTRKCGEQIPQSNLHEHLTMHCILRLVTCQNQGCKEEVRITFFTNLLSNFFDNFLPFLPHMPVLTIFDNFRHLIGTIMSFSVPFSGPVQISLVTMPTLF